MMGKAKDRIFEIGHNVYVGRFGCQRHGGCGQSGLAVEASAAQARAGQEVGDGFQSWIAVFSIVARLLDLKAADEHASHEDQSSAQSDLQGGGECRRVHVAMANPGDYTQFRDHHEKSERHGDVKIRNQKRQGMADSTQRGHGAADHAADPGMAAPGQAAIVGERLGESPC